MPVSRSVRSGAYRRTVRVPDDVVFARRSLPAAANAVPDHDQLFCIRNVLRRDDCADKTRVGYQIRVNWLTGGVDIAPFSAL